MALFPNGRPRFLGAVLGLAVAVAGCATAPPIRSVSGLPATARVAGVPVIEQIRHHCGPAALASVLTWAGYPDTPEALAPRVYLPGRKGTLPIDLSREIRSRGLLAYRVPPFLDAVLREVAAGHPALVLENRGLSWVPVWHYSVLVGFDRRAEEIVLHAGGPTPERVHLPTFQRTWSRGGSLALLALPPGRLPAADDPQGILEALSELEGNRHPEPARAGYEAFLLRRPDDWRGAFGLANALYALGEHAGAEVALDRARAAAPERPEPLNNLALVRWEAGRAEEARVLARGAVSRADALGIDPTPYRDTLNRVSKPR